MTVLHGDCLEVMAGMEAASVDAVVTDPPFFMPVQHYATAGSRFSRKWADTSVLSGWFRQVADEFRRLLKPSGHCLVFCDTVAAAVFLPVMYERWRNIDGLVWVKQTGMGSPWRRRHEQIIAACDVAAGAYVPAAGAGRSCGGNVFEFNYTPASRREHPVQKPVALLAELVKATTRPGGLVLDAFAGSGTTGEACVLTSRAFVGIEADAGYVDIARRRIDQATAQQELAVTA